jgi:hypothetical protein
MRFFDDPAGKVSTAKPTVDGDHGRIETRTATVSTEIEWLQNTHQWPGLQAIGKVERTRETLPRPPPKWPITCSARPYRPSD